MGDEGYHRCRGNIVQLRHGSAEALCKHNSGAERLPLIFVHEICAVNLPTEMKNAAVSLQVGKNILVACAFNEKV